MVCTLVIIFAAYVIYYVLEALAIEESFFVRYDLCIAMDRSAMDDASKNYLFSCCRLSCNQASVATGLTCIAYINKA